MDLNLLDQIDPVDLISFVRSIPTPGDFLLTSTILPERQIQSVKWRVQNTTSTRSAAKFRAYDAETPFGRRAVTHSFTEGYLPPLGQKLVVNEFETILLEMARGTDAETLMSTIYDDLESSVLGIRARLELAAGDVLSDGVFTLAENKLQLVADFGLPAGHLLAPATLWTNPAATPLSDEQAWYQQSVNELNGRPGDVVTSQRVVSLMANNGEYRAAYYGTPIGGTNPTATLNQAQLQTVRDNYGLPPIRVYDAVVDVDGVSTRPLADNKFVILPADKGQLGATQFGITAESLALARGGQAGVPRITLEQAPGIIGMAMEDGDPVRVYSKATAVAMPVLYNTGKLMVATVA